MTEPRPPDHVASVSPPSRLSPPDHLHPSTPPSFIRPHFQAQVSTRGSLWPLSSQSCEGRMVRRSRPERSRDVQALGLITRLLRASLLSVSPSSMSPGAPGDRASGRIRKQRGEILWLQVAPVVPEAPTHFRHILLATCRASGKQGSHPPVSESNSSKVPGKTPFPSRFPPKAELGGLLLADRQYHKKDEGSSGQMTQEPRGPQTG